jgi:hypothetical protein
VREVAVAAAAAPARTAKAARAAKRPLCRDCLGTGRILLDDCHCVARQAFHACLRLYYYNREMADRGKSKATLRKPFFGYERKIEDFLADFVIIARRHLPRLQFQLFCFFFIEGHSMVWCARRLRTQPANLYYRVRLVEQRLGRVFRNLRPYALYPPRAYFSGFFTDKEVLGDAR